jgi:acyl-CoA thioesterase
LTAGTSTAFDRATAVRPLGEGRFAATFDDAWSTPAGAHGGYAAAIVLRAMLASLATPERRVRSFTLHYLRPPSPGEAEVAVVEERAGRSLTTLTARVEQAGTTLILAIGAFSLDYPSALDYATPPPELPPFDALAPAQRFPDAYRFLGFFDHRPAFGPAPFSGGEEAVTGGWIRLREPRVLDAPAIALLADAWWPVPFVRMHEPNVAPTIDLTIHFRGEPPDDPDAPVAVRFTSTTSRDGLFEEDGELWAPDGTLLAQSRQLALLLPAP